MAVPGSGACLPTDDYSVRAMNHWWPASYSFSRDGYRDVLREHGLTLEKTHIDEGKNMYYLARKTP